VDDICLSQNSTSFSIYLFYLLLSITLSTSVEGVFFVRFSYNFHEWEDEAYVLSNFDDHWNGVSSFYPYEFPNHVLFFFVCFRFTLTSLLSSIIPLELFTFASFWLSYRHVVVLFFFGCISFNRSLLLTFPLFLYTSYSLGVFFTAASPVVSLFLSHMSPSGCYTSFYMYLHIDRQ